jgi:hypothetical protein
MRTPAAEASRRLAAQPREARALGRHATPAISDGQILLRADGHLECIVED